MANIELFDLIKIMFTDSKKYSEISNIAKSKHSFIVNRFFSIKYPSTAQSLNFNGINGAVLVDLWQMVASRYNKVPYWVYTKTKKTESQKEWYPPKELVSLYLTTHKMSEQDLKMMIKFNPTETKLIFDKLKKQTEL
jgi:hypothetical protein